MSHVATVEIEIKDLESLAVACNALGLELMLGQKTHKWYGRWVDDYSAQDAAYKNGIDTKDYGKCLHAVRVKNNPDAYEVGLVQKPGKPAGVYGLVFDFYADGKGLMAKVGKDCGKLAQEYAAQVAAKHCRKQGFQVKRTVGTDGKVRLVATK